MEQKMNNINHYFHEEKRSSRGSISITGKLEAYVGKYYVSGEGLEENIFLIYYDPEVDEYEPVDTDKEKLVACLSADYEYAFVIESMLEKFKKDTEEYNITIIPVKNIDNEELCVDDIDSLPEFLSDVKWINDDFLTDENIDFDFDSFELIDSGIIYLNPNHFSVFEMILAIKDGENKKRLI